VPRAHSKHAMRWENSCAIPLFAATLHFILAETLEDVCLGAYEAHL
jgi:hypothetical protein